MTLVCDAEIHQASTVLKKCPMQIQSDMGSGCEGANSLAIHVETAEELDQIACFWSHPVFIFLPFVGRAPSELVMGQSYGLAGLESTPVDLLEVFDVDSGVAVMEFKKRLITYMVVHERHPSAISHIRITRIVFRIVLITAALP